MIKVIRTSDYLEHSGTKGMKWGYNDGKRNGKRTASELKNLQAIRDEMAKEDDSFSAGSGNIEADYDEANNMLKYLGISLDLHSDDKSVAQTMNIYEQMRDSKDEYKSQYEWLAAFSKKLSGIGYDMSACDKYLTENKDKLNVMKTGTGSGESKKKTSTTKKSSTNQSSDKKKETKNETKKQSKEELAIKNQPKYRASKKKVRDGSYDAQRKAMANVKHYEEIQNGDELYHHGILGQKWGVRRYQNADGSLTDAGRKHYNSGTSNAKTIGKAVGAAGAVAGATAAGVAVARSRSTNARIAKGDIDVADTDRNSNDLSALKDTSKIVGRVKGTARVANKYVDKYENAKYRQKISDMSDDELEKEIQKALPEYQAKELRRQLERRYETVVGNPDSTKAGREAVLKALDVMGDVAMIAGTAVVIGNAIRKVT